MTIRDYVNVQRALVNSLGITRLHTVAGPSQGAYQAFEWGAAYPDVVARIIAVIGAAESNAYGIRRVNIWMDAIRLDPRWNHGNYYGREEPADGLALAFKMLFHGVGHYRTASREFGRRWAVADRDPARSWDNKFAAEEALDQSVAAWVKRTDANSFLYGARASQLFVTWHKGSLEDGLRDIKAKILLIPARSDLLVYPEYSGQAMEILKRQGKQVEYFEIEGDGGHLDGIFSIAKAGEAIRKFLNE